MPDRPKAGDWCQARDSQSGHRYVPQLGLVVHGPVCRCGVLAHSLALTPDRAGLKQEASTCNDFPDFQINIIPSSWLQVSTSRASFYYSLRRAITSCCPYFSLSPTLPRHSLKPSVRPSGRFKICSFELISSPRRANCRSLFKVLLE